MQRPTTYVFDAYGTLFDLSSAARNVLSEQGEKAALLSEIWRGRQLEYAWTDTALGKPTDFWDVTQRALDVALHVSGLSGDAGLRGRLLTAYAQIDAYPDALNALTSLKHECARLIVYSNANPRMLSESVAASGLDKLLDAQLSVDAVGKYKPHPETYAYLKRELTSTSAAIMFVSSNPWDAAGAANAGFRASWINRIGHSFPFAGVPVEGQLETLDELLA